MALSIIELLQRVGVEHVRVQNLLDSVTNVRIRKHGGAAVSFVTDVNVLSPNDLLDQPRNVGLILWLPRERTERAHAEYEAEQAAQDGKGE